MGGGEFATNNIAVYSPDRPRVIVHADIDISPWIDRDDLRRRGAVLVWEDGQLDAAALARLRSDYPGLEVQAAARPAAPDFRRARPRAAGARARRLRAAAAVAHVPQKLDLIGAGYRFGEKDMRENHSLPTASPSISTFRSGPARPAITR